MCQSRDQIEIFRFETGLEGPTLLVTGAVHGTEPCGNLAIKRVLADVGSGAIRITAGTVVFVPASNPQALQEGKRFIDANLNRDMYPRQNPQTYEDRLRNQLCPLLEETNILLDLHSYRAGGPAFAFLGPAGTAGSQRELEMAQALGIGWLVYGWEQVMRDARGAEYRKSEGTTEYARRFGAAALTLECGQHQDPVSVEVAYNAILNTLAHFGLAEIDPGLRQAQAIRAPKLLELRDVFFKAREGAFVRPLQNFEPVARGVLLAEFNDGGKIVAPRDGYIVMPDAQTVMGEEWFLIGVGQDPAAYLAPQP